MKKLSLLLIIILVLTGCSSKSAHDMVGASVMPAESNYDGMSYSASKGNYESDYAPAPAESPVEYELSNDPKTTNDAKIITNVSMGIETKEYEKSMDIVKELINSTGSYIEKLNESNNGYYSNTTSRVAEVVVRVPKLSLDAFLDKTGSIGEITYKNISSDDVSEYYYDTSSRLKVLETKETRILSLLEKADKMEDIIKLEDTLSDIIYEKEKLTGTLRGIDSKVEYSTLRIQLNEVARITPTPTVKESFLSRVKQAFKDSMYEVKTTTENIIIVTVYLIPTFIIMSVLVIIGLKLFNKYRKNKLR